MASTPAGERADTHRSTPSHETRFIGSVVHELNGPLTALRLQLTLLDHVKDDEARGKVADAMERSIARMQLLVRDLLDLARQGPDGSRHDIRPIDLQALVRTALEELGTLVAGHGKTIAWQVPDGLVVSADPARIHQVLANLVLNADRHTKAGGTITLQAVSEGTVASITVTDDGDGIAPDQIALLFQPFERLGRHGDGTGLGLFISQQIVQRHGGSIWCESDGPGQGSRFRFTIPLATAKVS